MSGKIAVNGRFLSQNLSGVQRFGTEIIKALSSLDPGRIEIYTPRSIESIPISGVEHRPVGALHGHAWEQLDLPIALRRAGQLPLLSFCNTGPVIYKNQYFTLHDVTYVRYPEGFSKSFRLAYGISVPLLLRRSRAIFTVSNFSASEITRTYGIQAEKVGVIYNATNATASQGGAQRPSSIQEPYFLTIGYAGSNKNIATLRDGYARYRAGGGTARMVVVGGYEDKPPITDEGIFCVGRVDDDELSRLYAHAIAYVSTSLYEGFGIPLIEAQAHGCPVVASDIPVHREVLGESAASYFEPMSGTALASAFSSAEHASRSSLASAGFVNASRFSWEESAGAILRAVDASQRVR